MRPIFSHSTLRGTSSSSTVMSRQTLTVGTINLHVDWSSPVSLLAWKKSQRSSTSFWLGERAFPRSLVSHVVFEGLGRVIGVCSPPPLNTLAGLNQFRTITQKLVPSTPLHGSAIAMDGCQECPRESRGDRVMSHDKRTCTDAST